jgi:hypothetical protein
MWLQIHATVRITDRRGHVFETITDKAMNNATNVSETNLNWKWTTERPVLNFKISSWLQARLKPQNDVVSICHAGSGAARLAAIPAGESPANRGVQSLL